MLRPVPDSVCAAPVCVLVALLCSGGLAEDTFRSATRMVSALACPRLVLALALVLALLHSAEGECSHNMIECNTGGDCIAKSRICDGHRHCSDGSDEDFSICKFWPPRSNSCLQESREMRFNYAGRCYNIHQICQNSDWSKTLNSRVCQIVLLPKLEPQQEIMNMTDELVASLSSAVNSTHDPRKEDCPMLYTRVGNDCLSFFSPAKVAWPEARQFCRSIYGDLWHFTDIASYGHLMAFIREEQFTSNYWIGGRFDLDTNAWSWTTDDSVMPLGAPYWTLNSMAERAMIEPCIITLV
ncbi:uncharacterized protein LOC127007284 isoform X2 [Eriocheir sinensis]|uniref:uncharacterized protein LOC127007284 isoform X2 n=1 Tax=Eriocheir sinensis TaxID=95602 RepID=UPI0021C8CA3C|nr:uncharacterized protein LOC127007284 isoform X2 [Eriocheir sinensis]